MSLGRRVSLWGPLVAYAALLFVGSSRSDLHLPDSVWDKSVHFACYAVLAFLAVRAFHGGLRPLQWRPTMVAVILSVLYGALDEFHQWFVPGRDANAGDLAADILGVVIGTALVWLGVSGARGRARAPGEVTVLEATSGAPLPRLEQWLQTASDRGTRVQRRRLSAEELHRRFPGSEPPLVFLDGRLVGCGAAAVDALRAAAGAARGGDAYNEPSLAGPGPTDPGRRCS